MRSKTIILVILIVLVLTGCKEEKKEYMPFYKPMHTDYLQKFGWKAERFASETKYEAKTLQSYKDHVDTIRTEGNIDLAPFFNKEVVETGYILKENTDLYNQIVAYILESEGKVIGGYLDFNHEVLQPDGVIEVHPGQTTPMFDANDSNKQFVIGRIIKPDSK
ncbi:DUF4830 domain-containing protein [Paenibacillus cineris]|uniref:DUF4830 domain-containing protein n=1 Tax=Paenibacillus cineris TaxID=237530 RepID=UPI001B03F634|nr:DUF4830 domain-containing protein [Paenibacillus cineris]GIO63705.1 hypothetical protein J43TS9_52790 [Paenibacillus cineris]